MWLVRDTSMVIMSNLVFLILLVSSLVDEFMLMPLYYCRIWVAENLKVLGQRRGDLLGVVKVTFLIYLSVLEKYDGELDYMFLSLSLSLYTRTHTQRPAHGRVRLLCILYSIWEERHAFIIIVFPRWRFLAILYIVIWYNIWHDMELLYFYYI